MNKSFHLSLLSVIASLFVSSVHADWGRGATLTPGWERIRQAATRAARHPMTWAPAVAGVAVYASGRDGDWAESLYEEAPVFGNSEKANKESDRYRNVADVLWMFSMLATDSGDEFLRNKARGVVVQVSAVNATYAVSNNLKALVDRKEPAKTRAEAEGDAFPSNHATGAFAHATLIRENMAQTRLPRPLAHGLTAAGYLAATGSAWGRIEAGGHHVSDQLVGAAIGNFVAMFVNDAFMGDDARFGVAAAADGGALLTASFEF